MKITLQVESPRATHWMVEHCRDLRDPQVWEPVRRVYAWESGTVRCEVELTEWAGAYRMVRLERQRE